MSFIIDSHQDLYLSMFSPNQAYHGQTNIEMIKKHLKFVHPSIYHDEPFYQKAERNQLRDDTLHQLNFYLNLAKQQKDIRLILDWHDVEQVFAGRGKVGLILHYEGAEAIHHVSFLKHLYACGVRSIGLVHNRKNSLASPAKFDDGEGLTALGIQAVHAMIELRMIIDVAHMNEAGVTDVYEVCSKRKYPFINSHSNCREVCTHLRNASDNQLRMIKEVGGIIGLSAVSVFNASHGEVTLSDFLTHLRHVKKRIGISHLGIGTDFGGMECKPIQNFATADDYPNLVEELNSRLNEMEVEAVLWHNYYNLYKKLWG